MSETYCRYYHEHFNVHIHDRNRNYVLETNCPYCKRYRRWLYYNDLVRNENSENPSNNDEGEMNQCEARNLEGILQITSMNILYEYNSIRNSLSSDYEALSRLGNVRRKTTLEEIIMNSSVSIHPSKEDILDDVLCVICRETIDDGEIIRTIKCSHYFHIDCIDRWLINNRTCPVCKYRLGK